MVSTRVIFRHSWKVDLMTPEQMADSPEGYCHATHHLELGPPARTNHETVPQPRTHVSEGNRKPPFKTFTEVMKRASTLPPTEANDLSRLIHPAVLKA